MPKTFHNYPFFTHIKNLTITDKPSNIMQIIAYNVILAALRIFIFPYTWKNFFRNTFKLSYLQIKYSNK